MRPLLRLRNHVAARHREIAPLVPGERNFDEHARDHIEHLLPLRVLERTVDAETAQLHLRAGFTSAEFHAATGDKIERGDAFGYPRGVVEVGGKLYDAVAEPDVARTLARRRQKDLGCARMRVLFQEVMLHFPYRCETEAIGQLDLLQSIAQKVFFGVFGPGPRHLMFVEKTEAHIDPAGDAPAVCADCTTAAPLRNGRGERLVRFGLSLD